MRGGVEDGGGRRGAPAGLTLALALAAWAGLGAQDPQLPREVVRLDSARFTFFALPRDLPLARSLLAEAVARDTFPGLSRPQTRAVIVIAPDARRFREWIGPAAPEWGAAVAMPELHRIVMQGSRASSKAGDPRVTLRHELAHLALEEAMGELPPRWFDEGYASFASGESGRDELLATNLALAVRGLPSLDELDALFTGGESRAQEGYALSQRAVAELAALDPARGLTLLFRYWRETRSLDQGVRRAYGVTETEFETRWKVATRRRYGALAVVADVTIAALFLLLVIGPLWLIRRQRDRRRLAALRAADDAAERREAEGALAAMLAGAVTPAPPSGVPDGDRSSPQNDDLIK